MKKITSIILSLLIIPAIVHSHVRIIEMKPGKEAVLTESPKKVMLQVSKSIENTFSKIEVFNQKEEKVSKDTVFSKNDTVMEVELLDDVKSGEYTVKWICMSLNGHKQNGSYKFIIK